jgi:tRNA G18 (ribose-2'-O)-methylase SpoU
MPIERIEDAGDPRVAMYRGLRDGELVRSRGLFVAEGRIVVKRVIEDRRYRVQSVLVSDAACRDLQSAWPGLDADVPIFVGDAQQLAEIAGYEVHRGCLAMVHRPPDMTPETLIATAQNLVILEAVSNADNVGGVFRNAAAFGVDGVLLSPSCCDPFYRKAIRTSMGAVLRVPFARAAADDWPGILAQVRAAGFTVIALTPREPCDRLDAYAASRPRRARQALIVGTEGAGLSPGAETAADHRVRIPMADGVDSLNLAVAIGIALYELRTLEPRTWNPRTLEP